jgi:sensor histidine kinase YesM
MRPPRTHHIREFINRGQNIVGNSLVLDKETIANVTKELADVLSYVLEIEGKIIDLEEKVQNNNILTVELVGDNF